MRNADVTARTLDVPGARLYYEVRGTGPLLLLNGVPMGTMGYAAVAALLADDYTVVTYDPRGMFHSTIADPAQDATPELLADDIHQLLSALATGPARVFGNSGGAISGLALVTRYPGQVRTLIAHEPPIAEILPDSERLRAATDEVCDTYTREGREAALKKYMAVTGIERFGPPPGSQAVSPPADVRASLDRFFRYILRPTSAYRPDLSALRTAPTRIVVGVGATSGGQLAHRAAVALARHLSTSPAGFPGGHTGFLGEPGPFACLLRQVLSEST